MINENVNDFNDIDYDDEFDVDPSETQSQSDLTPQNTAEFNEEEDIDSSNNDVDNNEEDILTQFLKSKGISNPKAIKQLDDSGNIQEVDFNDLSREEQLNILNSSDLDNNYGLENEEIEFINLLRDNKLSVKDYLSYFKQSAIDEYINSNSQPKYQIDDLTDEELYIHDLKTKFKELSEEDAALYLEHEKSNEDFWNKKINSLREFYKEKEKEKLEEEQLIQEEESKKVFKEYQDSIINAVNNLNSIESFDLEDSDKEKVLEFILGTDATGTNYLQKVLSDPSNLARAAWFLMDGSDSIKALNDYWAGVVKAEYDKGYQDALNGKSKTITKKSTNKTNKSTTDKFIKLGNEVVFDIDY